jgi:hypothetical protein
MTRADRCLAHPYPTLPRTARINLIVGFEG